MSVGLTKRQAALLAFIIRYHREREYMPSYSDMCDGLGLASKGSVHRLVLSLIERGWLRRGPKYARSLEIVERLGDGAFVLMLRPGQARFLSEVAERESTTAGAILRELVDDLMGQGR